MRKITGGIAATALSAPLVLGATGVAAADEFEQSSSTVGPEGASTSHVVATADSDGDGQVSYQEHRGRAGPDGAGSSSTESAPVVTTPTAC
ncbi:hypothetical protein [Saccharopolyspora sp. CA-218241]|uniref:hypothetical protein n=1 Tax=Saccharopolyspora sp. CA-218241 TaxID=3240027 RepID=UPI003D97ADE4